MCFIIAILSAGVSGQTATIVRSPAGPYFVSNTLTLTCMVAPPPASTATVTYAWTCTNCFANGITMQSFDRILTEMDNGAMISCSATINGTLISSNTFALQVTQGNCLCHYTYVCKKVTIGHLSLCEVCIYMHNCVYVQHWYQY